MCSVLTSKVDDVLRVQSLFKFNGGRWLIIQGQGDLKVARVKVHRMPEAVVYSVSWRKGGEGRHAGFSSYVGKHGYGSTINIAELLGDNRR